MTLSFSTAWPKRMGKWAGEPTYFVEKIWERLQHEIKSEVDFYWWFDAVNDAGYYQPSSEYKWTHKLHTIRKGNRWKVGDKIHMVINNRTRDRFQFAPVMEAKSVQEIEIDYYDIYREVRVNNKLIYREEQPFDEVEEYEYSDEFETVLDRLVRNDGFESVEQFFTYFSTDFKGQIVSWVDSIEY